jgi:negative regulator of flagellin synthesis FlgM
MKITDKNNYINFDAYTKNIREKEKIPSSDKQATKDIMKEDNVVLSPQAKKIQEAKKIMGSIPDIREEKVAQIKAQIENGTYHVEEKKLAAKMIKESLLNELV